MALTENKSMVFHTKNFPLQFLVFFTWQFFRIHQLLRIWNTKAFNKPDIENLNKAKSIRNSNHQILYKEIIENTTKQNYKIRRQAVWWLNQPDTLKTFSSPLKSYPCND